MPLAPRVKLVEQVPSYVPPCSNHRRGVHRWKVTLVTVTLFGILPPIVRIDCRRCHLIVQSDVVRITRPLLIPARHRRAAHAATKETR